MIPILFKYFFLYTITTDDPTIRLDRNEIRRKNGLSYDYLVHPSNGMADFGGKHGIGAGTHTFTADETGGTFSNLCERRLAFELSQHLTPEQATRSLIHR